MPFYSHVTPLMTVAIFPHVLSRVEVSKKIEYQKTYKKIKKYGCTSIMTGVVMSEGTTLVKDVISSKLKAYGYKSLFAITAGPIIQFISLPLYVFTFGSRFRKFAVATTEIGAKISKGEMGIVNWSWIGMDLILFGEPVPITDDSDFLMIHNETIRQLPKIIEELGGAD